MMEAFGLNRRHITVEEYKNTPNIGTIKINNFRYQKNFSYIIKKIIREFFIDDSVFWGFYRVDCLNLTRKQQKKLESEIPAFFQDNGDIEILSKYLIVARINSNEYDYDFVPYIFDYYLDTIMFNSKVDWEVFKKYHFDYLNHKFEDIILNHFADMLLFYHDSGDLSICFDSQKYKIEDVKTWYDSLS